MNGSVAIPEKFKLSGKTIKVIVDDDYCQQENCLGEADFTERLITLSSYDSGIKKKLSKKEKEQTFFHELVHMILDSMGKDRLKYDEDFVDTFAMRLHEYERTKV